jgi:hypothetical protein
VGRVQVITDILNGFDVSISVGGSLSVQAFSFNCGFDVRLGKNRLKFNLAFNFQMSKIADMVNKIWQQVKGFIMKAVPGMSKLKM